MATDLDRRTYDLLRLIDGNEPIGSIRLVDLMQQRGYSIKGRTIRLLLSELDEAGLTTKVPGKGRRLTETGRHELRRGDVTGRLQQIRERISVLTSRVTYDPSEHVGELVTSAAYLDPDDLDDAFDALERLSASPLGPVLVDAEGTDDGRVRLSFPSSITLDGILLSHGISSDLLTAGLVEYRPPDADEDAEKSGIVRYVDTISGEGSSMDVVSLLIEAGRTDVEAVLDGETGLLIVDAREFPLTRFAEGRDLTHETRDALGGVVDVVRPRESGPFPTGEPGWDFASLTYAGVGETALSLLYERSLLEDWETISGPRSVGSFERASVGRAGLVDGARTFE
jgi:hypothetical protein